MDHVADDEVDNDSHAKRHIDTIVEKNSPSIVESREVDINSTDDWGSIGAVLFLTPEELEKQGIDPETADKVVVRVQNGFILMDPK